MKKEYEKPRLDIIQIPEDTVCTISGVTADDGGSISLDWLLGA